ncbi:MAG TPA: hypothetical protein VKX16_10115 [Chloroflexota bacterium]|nr:hypothetical protein [Chloroflexota bacterium]
MRRLHGVAGSSASRSIAVIAAILVLATPFAGSSRAATSLTVNVAQRGTVIGSDAIGINATLWGDHYYDAPTLPALTALGTSIVRFPGGSTSDEYHWATNSVTKGSHTYINPANGWPSMLQKLLQPARQHLLITVNYGTNQDGTGGGDPGEAAAWVKDANLNRGLGVRSWEIGNETYGNGYYGIGWEPDRHAGDISRDQKEANPALSPSAYAANAHAFVTAMKAVDPSIKVFLVLAPPGSWFDITGKSRNGKPVQPWNATVLQNSCAWADGYAIHFYPQDPGTESDAKLLAHQDKIAARAATLQQEYAQYCPGHHPQTILSESNSVTSRPGRQTVSLVNGLFAAEDVASWLQAGIANVDWWSLYCGGYGVWENNSPSLYGWEKFGDYGILSSGRNFDHKGQSEPLAGTPFPAYYGLQLAAAALPAGAAFLQVQSGSPSVVAYAARASDGSLNLLLLNTDPANSTTVSPTFVGFAPTTASATWIGEDGQQGFTLPRTASLAVSHGTFTATLGPYSLTLIHLLGS